MALSVGATREALAGDLSAKGSWIAAYTSSSTEASGGGYLRAQVTWSGDTPADGIYASTKALIPVPSGTYTHVAVFANSTGGSPVEVVEIADQVFSSPGTLEVTLTITVV